MFVWNPYAQVRVIVRRKLAGGGDHYGVLLPDGSVLDLNADGVRLTVYQEFESGLPVKVVYAAPVQETWEILARVQEALSTPQAYRFLVWNCEHFANWLVGRPAESTQINGAILLGLGFACWHALAK